MMWPATEFTKLLLPAGMADPIVGGPLKRVFDLGVTLVAIILLSPLLAFLAISLRVAQGGPILVKHTRIGKGGVPFPCLKFRTMAVNADDILRTHLAKDAAALQEWKSSRKLRYDPRVTALGHVLRTTSLDELPQLFNIIRGEMSLVGPRPIVEQEIDMYGDAMEHYLVARPGLTGLWQVNGRSDLSYASRVAFDIQYVRTWHFGLDLFILFKTVAIVIRSKGSY